MQQRLQVHEEPASGLLQRPATRGTELQDAHALNGCVMWPASGPRPLPTAILDANLLPEHGDLAPRLFEFRVQLPTSGRLCTDARHDDAGQGDGVKDARPDVLGPLFG
jgi:hypothetical protein